MSHSTALIWLKIAGLILVPVGIVFSWATSGPLSVLNQAFVDLAFWPFDGGQSYAAPETRLLSGIAGGVTAGLGLAIWAVAREVFATDPARGRRIILIFMSGWFLVDGVGSVIAGAWFNVIPNLAILMMVIWPLVRWQPEAAAA